MKKLIRLFGVRKRAKREIKLLNGRLAELTAQFNPKLPSFMKRKIAKERFAIKSKLEILFKII